MLISSDNLNGKDKNESFVVLHMEKKMIGRIEKMKENRINQVFVAYL